MALDKLITKEENKKSSLIQKVRTSIGAACLTVLTALITPSFGSGCGDIESLDNVTESSAYLTQNRCGGSTPCNCGDILAENRKLTTQDNLQNCYWNTVLPALAIKNGAKLDCNGHTISVQPDNKGNYENNRTAIFIKHDSNNSSIANCKIYGFSEAIYVELNQKFVKKNGNAFFEYEAPENLAFIGNKISLGSGECYSSSCGESHGIWIRGWPSNPDPPKNILILGNTFKMAKSEITNKDSFLNYGSYIRTTSAKNLQIWLNKFDNITYGYAIRLLYGVEANVIGNTFNMPWEHIKSKFPNAGKVNSKWIPSGIAFELYNGTKYGYPKFNAWLNTFKISEDPQWPPEPFGTPPLTGVNHEYVVIRAAPGSSLPPIDMRFNWWKELNGKNYPNSDLVRLIYDKNFTVNGKKVEPTYREVNYLPRLY